MSIPYKFHQIHRLPRARYFSKWLFFLVLFCGIKNSAAQESDRFRQLSKKDGLSQVSVFAIAQDSAGFMWFGTRNGLNRFDGYEFKVYKKDTSQQSLVSDNIRNLYADPLTGDLWIGTVSGLGKYRHHLDIFENYSSVSSDSTTISGKVIRQIFRDSKNRLWVATSNGINLYNDKTKQFSRYRIGPRHSDFKVDYDFKTILEDRKGQLWFGTNRGLFKLSETDKENHSFTRADQANELMLSDTHIQSLVEDKLGNFWIGTAGGGLNYWNREKKTVDIYKNEEAVPGTISNNDIRSLALDKNGDLWIGTFSGLNLLKNNTDQFEVFQKGLPGQSGLSDNSVHSVFVDRRGSIWAGTYYGGVNYMDDNYSRFTNVRYAPHQNSISSDLISSFAEDKNGNLWIGTEGTGLNFYDQKTKKFQQFFSRPNQKNSIGGNNIKELLLKDDQLFIGTFRAGVTVLNIKTQEFSYYKNDPDNTNSLAGNSVYSIHKEADKLWMLTYEKGLDVLDLTKNKFYHYRHETKNKNALSSDLGRVILKTSDQQIWIGTEKGLNKVTRDRDGLPANFEIFLPEERIFALQESQDGKIWIGTFSNGIFSLNPQNNEIEHFPEITSDATGNSVLGILEVNPDEFWLSTNNGLVKFNPREKTFTNYNYSNGLANLEYNFNAYFKTRSGDLLFGGINGFTRFNPKDIQPSNFVPPVVFTQLEQNNKVVSIHDQDSRLKQNIDQTSELEFAYNEANFTINFAALDYISPDNNRYAYKLEGLDKDWNYTVGKTEANYAIQREGNYVFRLKGANSDGVWNPVERKIDIVVRPPLYRTAWAYLLYFLLLLAGIAALVRYIRLRHKLQLQQVAKEKQDELHELKLRFYTNITHEFRTPLTLILGPLRGVLAGPPVDNKVRSQLTLVEENAQRLLDLVNQLMTFRKLATDHEPMKIVSYDMVSFLEEIFLLFRDRANTKNITYQFDTAYTTLNVGFDQKKLEKVFFNLLSNAFKFTPEGGKITLSLTEKNQSVEVRVQDSGPGVHPELHGQIFKRFYEKTVAQSSAIKGSGIGLAISKQMVELHGGKIFVASDAANKPGATFVVRIPMDKSQVKPELQREAFPVDSSLTQLPVDPVSVAVVDRASPAPSKDPQLENLPLLLIVEDNPEIRMYIQQVLTGEYRFVTAENGAEGLEKAKSALPDLIISDVMMPKMDGIEFCGQLKSNIEISHIPIILLTARTAALFKIEGLKTGADDYITKPFNPEELRLRVRNIIQSRQEIRNKFARVLNFDPKEISITSADELFLEKAMEIAEQNIDNYEFNVLQFATDLAVSRALLFTKLKALTGQTPNNFIKTIRLKRAAQLLKTQKLNVSEVAYMVGFKDPKYFRKCFKAQFSILPSHYGVEKNT